MLPRLEGFLKDAFLSEGLVPLTESHFRKGQTIFYVSKYVFFYVKQRVFFNVKHQLETQAQQQKPTRDYERGLVWGSFSSIKLPKKGWASERESSVEFLLKAQPYSLRQP